MGPRILTAALLATALAGGLVAGTAAGQSGPEPDAGDTTRERVKDPQARRVPDHTELGPAAGGTLRVAGANRYETAVAVAQFAGWDFTNTVAVYIASGEDYPDALAVGPATMDLGPLLLVRRNGIPPATRAFLEEVLPCYIVVVGGPVPIPPAVESALDQYVRPEFCGQS